MRNPSWITIEHGRPVRKKDPPRSHNKESDDSDDEEMLPMESFWPVSEEDWTVVERSH